MLFRSIIQNMISRPQYSPACQYNMILVYIASIVAAVLMLSRYLRELAGDILRIIDPGRGGRKKGEEDE